MEEIGSLDQKQKEESINNQNETGEELHSHSKDVESESNDINTKKNRPPRKTNRTKSTETLHIEPVVLQLDFECLKCCQKFNSLNELEDHTSNHEVDKVQLKAVDTHSSKKDRNIKNDTQRAKTNAFESCERNDDYIVSLEMECENVEEEHERSIGFRTVATGNVQSINKEYTIENVAFEAKECPSADKEPFVCTHCEKSFKTFAEYKVHTATHDIELEDQKVIKPSETEPLTNRIKVFAEIHAENKADSDEEIDVESECNLPDLINDKDESSQKHEDTDIDVVTECELPDLKDGNSVVGPGRNSQDLSRKIGIRRKKKTKDTHKSENENPKKTVTAKTVQRNQNTNNSLSSLKDAQLLLTKVLDTEVSEAKTSASKAKNKLMNPSKGKQRRVIAPKTKEDELLLRQFGIIPSKVCLSKVTNADIETCTPEKNKTVSNNAVLSPKLKGRSKAVSQTSSPKRNRQNQPLVSSQKTDDSGICADFSDSDNECIAFEKPLEPIPSEEDDDSDIIKTSIKGKTEIGSNKLHDSDKKSDSELLKQFGIKDSKIKLSKTQTGYGRSLSLDGNETKELCDVPKHKIGAENSKSVVTKSDSPRKKRIKLKEKTEQLEIEKLNIEKLSNDEMDKLLKECGMSISVPVPKANENKVCDNKDGESRKKSESPEPSTSKGHGRLKRKRTARKSCQDADLIQKFKLKESSVLVKCLSNIEISMLRNPHSSFGKKSWLAQKFDTDSESDIEWDIPSPSQFEDIIDNANASVDKTTDESLMLKFGLTDPVVVLNRNLKEQASPKKGSFRPSLDEDLTRKFGLKDLQIVVAKKKSTCIREKSVTVKTKSETSDEELRRKFGVSDLKIVVDNPLTTKHHHFSLEELQKGINIAQSKLSESAISKASETSVKEGKKQGSSNRKTNVKKAVLSEVEIFSNKKVSEKPMPQLTEQLAREACQSSSNLRSLRKRSSIADCEAKGSGNHTDSSNKSVKKAKHASSCGVRSRIQEKFAGRNVRSKTSVRKKLAIKTSKARSAILQTEKKKQKDGQKSVKRKSESCIPEENPVTKKLRQSVKNTHHLSTGPLIKLSVDLPLLTAEEIQKYTLKNSEKEKSGLANTFQDKICSGFEQPDKTKSVTEESLNKADEGKNSMNTCDSIEGNSDEKRADTCLTQMDIFENCRTFTSLNEESAILEKDDNFKSSVVKKEADTENLAGQSNKSTIDTETLKEESAQMGNINNKESSVPVGEGEEDIEKSVTYTAYNEVKLPEEASCNQTEEVEKNDGEKPMCSDVCSESNVNKLQEKNCRSINEEKNLEKIVENTSSAKVKTNGKKPENKTVEKLLEGCNETEKQVLDETDRFFSAKSDEKIDDNELGCEDKADGELKEARKDFAKTANKGCVSKDDKLKKQSSGSEKDDDNIITNDKSAVPKDIRDDVNMVDEDCEYNNMPEKASDSGKDENSISKDDTSADLKDKSDNVNFLNEGFANHDDIPEKVSDSEKDESNISNDDTSAVLKDISDDVNMVDTAESDKMSVTDKVEINLET